MKITTQRQFLWAANFGLVLSLLAFVFLMQQHGGRERAKSIKSYHRALEKAVQSVRIPIPQIPQDDEPNDDIMKTFLDKDFAFEGYLPPPELPPVDPPSAPTAPELSSLIEVTMLLAPRDPDARIDSGPQRNRAGAFINIKSVKNGQFSNYFFTVGETIGAGHAARADNDALLEKWGPCVLLDVTPDGILCSWNKEQDEVMVKIAQRSHPEGVWIDGKTANGKDIKIGGPGSINNLKTKAGVVTPVGTGLPLFKPFRQKDGQDFIELTAEGLKIFDRGDGEKLLGEIGTKATKGGLEVTSMPSRLREVGLRQGDVIVRVDNVQVRNESTITNYIRKNYKKKSSFSVTVLRDGRQRIIGVSVPKNTKSVGSTQGLRFGK